MSTISMLLAWLLAGQSPAAPPASSPPAAAASEPDTKLEPSAAERIAVAERHIADYRAELVSAGGTAKALERIERPLVTFGDPVRQNDNGTLWGWGRSGRPRFFLEVYQSDSNRRQWIQAITLTSKDLVELSVPDNSRWTPKTAGIDFLPVEGAVGESERLRLRQMKEIAGRLAAHEFWDPKNSRYELRLLIQPVLRYTDREAGIVDGATFVIAHGTNPEILVLIEAAGEDSTKSRWQLGAVRLGSAEMHLQLDDKEIWSVQRTPNIVGSPEEPYWLFIQTSQPTPTSP